LVLVICSFGLALNPYNDEDRVDELFSSFVDKFNKNYQDDELLVRREIFKENLQIIQRLNQESHEEASSKDFSDSAEFGVNAFSDLSAAEFRKFYLMSNFEKPEGKTLSFDINMTRYDEHYNAPNDTLFDWSHKGKTTRIYNQGQCGSCWAFSVTEQLESMWAIAGKPLTSLSMQQLVDCDHTSHGCGGGSPSSAWNYLRQAGGQDSYSSYPYIAKNERCKFEKTHIVAKFQEWGYVTQHKDETVMKKYLLGNGPISVCVDATSWQHYKSGVLRTCGKSIDHCVQITGFEESKNAWHVRNSWGTAWGVEGYIFVEHGHDVCAIAQVATTVKI